MNCNTAMSHTAVMCEINAPCRHDIAILLTKLRTANGTKKAATLPPSLDNQHLYVLRQRMTRYIAVLSGSYFR